MSLKTRKVFCPQCGAGHCQPVPGVSNMLACQSCGTQFIFSNNGGVAQVQIAQPVSKLLWPQMQSLRWAIGFLLLALAVGFLLPPLLERLQQSSDAAVQRVEEGRLDTAALYENSGGQFSHIQLLQGRKDEQEIFRIKVTDMQTGKLLSEPREYRFAWNADGSNAFRRFSDDKLYLTLKDRMLLRFDPGAQQFVDITAQVAERFAPQLSSGISKIKVAYRSNENLEITTSDGTEYLASWISGQIFKDAEASQAYEQAVPGYTQLRTGWRLAPVDGPGSISNRRYLLVQTWSKWEPGQIFINSHIDLYPSSSERVKEDRRGYVDAGSGYSVRPYLKAKGFVKLEAVETQTPRFNAQVLAQNSKRVLLVYSPEPDSSKPRVLQLLDKENRRIVWSRTLDQIEPLRARAGNWYAGGIAVASGFYIPVNGARPGFYLDNEGGLVHDFAADKP